MQHPDEPTTPAQHPAGRPARRALIIAAAAAALLVAYLLRGCLHAPSFDAADARRQVEQRAGQRMSGVRCIGAKATPAEQEEIAEMLSTATLSPHGSPPPWLPLAPAGDAWARLSRGCPDAPAFGTPFGFPSAEIEKTLRADPGFAAAADRRWAAIARLRAAHEPASTAAPPDYPAAVAPPSR